MTIHPIVLRTVFGGILLTTVLQDAPPQQDDLLSGPPVAEKTTRTLINTNARGEFMPLEVRPEEAALALMPLDPDRREAAREAAEQYRYDLGMFVVDQIDLVKMLSDASRDGDREQAQQHYIELHTAFDPDHRRAPMLDIYRDVLGPDELAEVERLVEEYWEAWIDWQLRSRMNADEDARLQVQEQLVLGMFQRELLEAHRWSLGPYSQRLEVIYQLAQPDEEQRQQIREVVLDLIREAGINATSEQKTQVAHDIYALLSEEQRLRFFEYTIWQQ